MDAQGLQEGALHRVGLGPAGFAHGYHATQVHPVKGTWPDVLAGALIYLPALWPSSHDFIGLSHQCSSGTPLPLARVDVSTEAVAW